jgi:hypothetical protein
MRSNQNSSNSIEWLLFFTTLLAFAYFHQGGGWNQNARFALVRSMTEQGTFSIDSYLVYLANPIEDVGLLRAPVSGAQFEFEGNRYRLGWPDGSGKIVPVQGESTFSQGKLLPVEQVAATGDVSFAKGRFSPAKAPGTSFLAVPVYFVLQNLEKLAGVNLDHWWVMTTNAWLISAFSVGLVSAAGCVLFMRLAMELFGCSILQALVSSYFFAFGTLFFPYATMFYEHNLVAIALLAAFYFVVRAENAWQQAFQEGTTSAPSTSMKRLFLFSGICAGWAGVTNYFALALTLVLLAYIVVRLRQMLMAIWFSTGFLAPLTLLGIYHALCFGTPFTTNYHHQSPHFQESTGALMNVFWHPSWEILLAILFSPFRGLFVGSPILLTGVAGLVWMSRERRTRSQAALIIAIITAFLAFNISFNGWHGGWTVGPRYLVPAVPFLSLPIVLTLRKLYKTTLVLGFVSVAIGFLVTAVDPQAPVGSRQFGVLPDKLPPWRLSPLSDYELPLFLTGKADSLLQRLLRAELEELNSEMISSGVPAPERSRRIEQTRQSLTNAIERQQKSPFLLASLRGPVSVNPVGVYESGLYSFFPPGSKQSTWNSFNAGEFIFPESRLSLLPLLLVVVVLVAKQVALARHHALSSPRFVPAAVNGLYSRDK